MRAQRHAHSDFASSLAHRVRNHAVKSDSAQNQSQCREASDEVCRGAVQVGCWRFVDDIAHGRTLLDADVLVELMDCRRKDRQDGALILCCAYDKIEAGCWVLVEGKILRWHLPVIER